MRQINLATFALAIYKRQRTAATTSRSHMQTFILRNSTAPTTHDKPAAEPF